MDQSTADQIRFELLRDRRFRQEGRVECEWILLITHKQGFSLQRSCTCRQLYVLCHKLKNFLSRQEMHSCARPSVWDRVCVCVYFFSCVFVWRLATDVFCCFPEVISGMCDFPQYCLVPLNNMFFWPWSPVLSGYWVSYCTVSTRCYLSVQATKQRGFCNV